MKQTVWLASYPKSGNTWMRMLISCLLAQNDDSIDINSMPIGIASMRATFEHVMLVDSGILTHDEIDRMRPDFYREMARSGDGDDDEKTITTPARFIKVHDAYTLTSSGEPLMGGSGAAKAAIVIVRDPRAVVPSLANHLSKSIEQAIAFLNSPCATLGEKNDNQAPQLRQILLGWSSHIASWLDQSDLPVHLVRYEDLHRDAASCLLAAMRFISGPVTADAAIRAAEAARFEKLQAQERRAGFAEWENRAAAKQPFFRKGMVDGWRDELSRDQIARIEAAHAPMMARLGYALSASQAE